MVFAIKKQQLLAVAEWGPFPWEGNGHGMRTAMRNQPEIFEWNKE